MDIDAETPKVLWNSSIILLISLPINENASQLRESSHSQTLYFPILRHSYITMFSKQFREYFGITSTSPAWFEVDGKPLQWHYPIGVLYDCLGSHKGFPWNITIHFDHYPMEEILLCPEEVNFDTIKIVFNDSVKQANAIKFGDIKSINDLNERESGAMWGGLSRNDFSTFYEINKKIFVESRWKHVPIRIFRPKQRSIQNFVDVGDAKDFDLFETIEKVGVLGQGIMRAPNLRNILVPSENNTEYEITIQGIHPLLSSSIRWLSQYLSTPDNFLYIVVKKLEYKL